MSHRQVVILANVGNRDVLYEGKELRPAREKGEELLGHFDEESSQIELPILNASLRYISSLHARYPEVRNKGERAPRVGLFATDQNDSPHRDTDTVNLAKIAEKKLPQMFPESRENTALRLNRKKPVSVQKITDNPARYDLMYRYYESFFKNQRRLGDPEGWLCFVLTSGGTPAMNAMLILHAIQHFGENCVQIYTSPGGEPIEMRVGKQIAEADARRRFNEVLQARQFRAARRIAKDAFSGYRLSACAYADYRLAFDFRLARIKCDEAVRMAEDGDKDLLERHAEQIANLECGEENPPLLIQELLYNLEIKYLNGEYVDVLGRAFRLQEALLTWVVEQNTTIRTGERKRLLPDQQEAVGRVPGLRESLERYRTTEGKNLELGREINRVSLLAIVEHLANPNSGLSDDRRERASSAARAAKGIEKLASLRNRTILAHGFEGVSEERFKDEYGPDDLSLSLREALGGVLGGDLPANPFSELAQRLKF